MRLITLFSVFILCSPTFAHFPQNTTFKVFQFPDSHVPQMDGDDADWSMVPDEYFYDSSHHRGMVFEYSIDSTGTKNRVLVPDTLAVPDPTDFDIRRTAIGWNKTSNRLYFITEVYDDVWRFKKDVVDSLDTYHSRMTGAFVHGSDIWEIVIDADHGGEKVINFADWQEAPDVEFRHRSAYAQNYHLYMPPLNGYYWHWLWGKAMWTKEERYSAMGWQGDVEHLSSGTVTYETYLTPFDDLHPEGPHLSRKHRLTEGAIIGLSWAYLDADDSDEVFDDFWMHSHHPKMYCSAEYLSDFELMPIEEGLFEGP